MDELRFDGRAAVVTGAGRGVGRAHALLLASRGAQVVVADIGAELDGSGSSTGPAEEVVAEIVGAGGTAVACHASVAEPDGAAQIVRTALDEYGRIDVVLNNVGITDKGLFADLTRGQFEAMIAVHYYGTLNTVRAAWPHFVDAGYGRIVNTASEGIFGAQPMISSYGAAKGAVWALTRNLAIEGRPYGITANCVSPRARTRLSEDGKRYVDESRREQMDVSLARMDPELVAPAAAFLAHESCPLNGEVLVAGGGAVMRWSPMFSRGIDEGKDLTVEDVAFHLDAILDMDGARICDVGGYIP